MSKPQERINASTLEVGYVIAVERRGEYLRTTRRRTDVLHATVTGKDVVTVAGMRQRRYAITTDLGDVEPCPGIQTFPLISRPTVPAGAPDAAALVVGGTVVAMVEHHDVTTDAPAAREVPTCTDKYGHVPGIPGCPVTVRDCNGVPTELGDVVTESPVRTGPAASGADQVGSEIAERVAIRHTVTDVRAGYSDPGRNRGVREVSTWSMLADGHRVTVVRYEARDTLMSTVKPYASVLVDGEHVDRIPASKLEYGTARVVWDYLAELATAVPIGPEVPPAPAVDQVDTVPAVDQVDTVPAVAPATVDEWAGLFGVDAPAAGDQVDAVPAVGSLVLVDGAGNRPFVSILREHPDPRFRARGWHAVNIPEGAGIQVMRNQFRPAPTGAELGYVDQNTAPAIPPVGDLTNRSHVGPWLVLAIPHGADPSPIVGQVNPHWITQGTHESRAVATRQAVTLAASGQWGGVRVCRHHQGSTVAEWYASNTTGWSEWGAITDRGWIERAQDEIDGFRDGDQGAGPAPTAQTGSVRVQLIDGAGTVVQDWTRPTWARGIRSSEREVYAIGATQGAAFCGEESTRTGVPGTTTDTYRRMWRSAFGQLTAVVTRPAPAVTPTQGPATRPAVDQVDTAPAVAESAPAPAVTVTIEERPSGTPVVEPSADAPYAPTWERYAPAINRPDVPAGMPYVIDAPEGWDGPVVQLEAKQVAAMLRGKRGFLAAWFPGGKFSVRTDGGSIDVRWMGGPAADLVDLVAKMWQGKDRDSQAECDRYRGTVLYVAPDGTETAYRLPGVYVFTRRERDTAPADLEAARAFLPDTGGREFTYGEFVDPYGREWFGGSADECARWMAERGVTRWTRNVRAPGGDSRPVCPVKQCADAAGHPWPGMHRNDYGRAFLATLPEGDGDQGGDGGAPTDVDPVGPAPAGDQVDAPAEGRPSFRTWAALAAWIAEGRTSVVTAPGPDVPVWTPPAPADTATVSFTCPAHGAVTVPVNIDGSLAQSIKQLHQPCTDGDPFGLLAIERECSPVAQLARTLRAAGWSPEEIERATADQVDAPTPDVRPLYTVTNDGHGTVRVHAVGCRDIGRDVRRDGVTVGDHWDERADHVRDIVCAIYDDATPENWREFLDIEVMPCADLDESDDAPAVAEDTAPARTMEQIRAEISAKLEAERASLLSQAESAGAEMHADGMPCAPESSGWFARISSAVSVDSAEEMRPRLRDAFVRGYQTAADRAAEQTPALTVRPGQLATIRGWSGASVFVTAVADGHVIGIESGGSVARVALDMVTAVEDLTPDAAAVTARGYLTERRQADDVRPGLEALAGTAPAGLGDSAALIEEGPEDAPYHVVHTKDGGTEVHGSSRGDGVWDVLKKWGRPRSFGGSLYLRNTRNKLAVPSRIRSIGADIAKATGRTVRIVVDNRAADVIAREADRIERVDARVAKFERRSERRTVEAHQLRDHAEKLTEGIPMGEPVKVDHYSGPRHQRALDRSEATHRKSWEAGARADYAAQRAAGAADNEAAKHDPRAMIRRRERLQEDERGLLRRYNGEPHPDTINGQRLAELREEIAIITGRLAKMAADGEFVAWTRDDFRAGDEVNVGGHWRRVIRANPTTVTVPWWASTTPDTDKKGDTTPYDKIHGRRRDGWQLDKPNGEPWPVSDAKRVDRWLSLTAEANRPYSEEPARRRRVWVQIAERIGYGLDVRNATSSEVEAYRLKDERLRTVAGRRAWYLQLLDIFERLAAGEKADAVAASVQAADIEPAWKMPAGTPVDVRVDQLRRGDIIAGYWDTSGLGSRDLARHFCGPVAYVSKVDNRRERGDWVTVRLVDGQEKAFKSHIWFATFPQGRPTVKVADLVKGQRADIRGRDQFGKPSRCWGYVSAPTESREGKRNRAGDLTGHPMLGVTVSETPSGLGGIVMQIFTERDAWCAVLDDREPAQLDAVALADEAGEAAYRAGRSRAPGIDTAVRELIADLPVGSGSTTIMEAFTRGYDRAAAEAARLVLAGADK